MYRKRERERRRAGGIFTGSRYTRYSSPLLCETLIAQQLWKFARLSGKLVEPVTVKTHQPMLKQSYVVIYKTKLILRVSLPCQRLWLISVMSITCYSLATWACRYILILHTFLHTYLMYSLFLYLSLPLFLSHGNYGEVCSTAKALRITELRYSPARARFVRRCN